MTAEIVIANGNGVALAADSAVTVGGKKIYNSAIKVFSLSKINPVGIMIYGNATLQSVPWEIIIKKYRAELKNKSFDELEQYAKNFLDYIPVGGRFINKEIQDRWVVSNVRGYYLLIRSNILRAIEIIVKEKCGIGEDEVNNLTKRIIEEHYLSIKNKLFICNFDADFENEIKVLYSDDFKKIKNEIFEKIKLTKTQIAKLIDIATWIHTREIFVDSVSGIVIAGYGKNEIYPSVLSYKVEGAIEGKLKYKLESDKSHKITSGNDCIIIPFAQEEMVSTFMHGIAPELADLVSNFIRQLFNRIPELIKSDQFKDSVCDHESFKNTFNKISNNILDKFFKNFKDHIQERQIEPIMSMVQILPKDELASMAETLVNLTAFKRRVSNSLETVGGPIDVAVISLGDGLVWVKRKQYFPKELNSHFFDNYLREITNDD